MPTSTCRRIWVSQGAGVSLDTLLALPSPPKPTLTRQAVATHSETGRDAERSLVATPKATRQWTSREAREDANLHRRRSQQYDRMASDPAGRIVGHQRKRCSMYYSSVSGPKSSTANCSSRRDSFYNPSCSSDHQRHADVAATDSNGEGENIAHNLEDLNHLTDSQGDQEVEASTHDDRDNDRIADDHASSPEASNLQPQRVVYPPDEQPEGQCPEADAQSTPLQPAVADDTARDGAASPHTEMVWDWCRLLGSKRWVDAASDIDDDVNSTGAGSLIEVRSGDAVSSAASAEEDATEWAAYDTATSARQAGSFRASGSSELQWRRDFPRPQDYLESGQRWPSCFSSARRSVGYRKAKGQKGRRGKTAAPQQQTAIQFQ